MPQNMSSSSSRSDGPFSARVSVPLWAMALAVLIVLLQGTLSPLRALVSSSSQLSGGGGGEDGPWRLDGGPSSSVVGQRLRDESNVPIPKREDGTSPMSLEERVRYLELKTNAHMNFGSDPLFGSKPFGPSAEDDGHGHNLKAADLCEKVSDLTEFGCLEGWEGYGGSPSCPGLFSHRVCLDDLPPPGEWNPKTPVVAAAGRPSSSAGGPPPPCLVYDFGIRAQPQFGAVMARIFGCEVHAFDPSPVSKDWWNGSDALKLRRLPNYHFHPYGAGGIDGDLTLMEYDWGQVSILRYPENIVDCGDAASGAGGEEACKLKAATDFRKAFTLPVKTLPTIRSELGHEGRTIDILKLDVEGSEYAFLESALDRGGGGLPGVDQVALEWHHMPWDARYGEGSSPPINAIVTLLHASGLRLLWQYSVGGWPSNVRAFHRLEMRDVRYNLASFMRKKTKKERN